MPGYNSVVDPITFALRAIALVEVTRLLEPTLGVDHPAVREAFGAPIPLTLVPSLRLPSISVYVRRETDAHVGRHKDRRLDVVLEYIGPPMALHEVSETWPLLRAVWHQCLTCIEKGTIYNGSIDVDVLRIHGVTWVSDEEATVDYDFAPGGEFVYPAFVGTVPMMYRPQEANADALPGLTELYATINLFEGGTERKHALVVARGVSTP